MKRSGVNPGVHLTCGRFEDGIELLGSCAFARDPSREAFDQRQDWRSLSGEKTAEGKNQDTGRECTTQTRGCLGLASMG